MSMQPIRYPLALQGVFRTFQGEGALLGTPMVFIRLAGCSIGCQLCDTDYAVRERVSADDIALRAVEISMPGDWVWITGGEPTDHNLAPLLDRLSGRFRIALATAGEREIDPRWPITWLSVSPHNPSRWVQRDGSELKLVPGLNGLRLDSFSNSETVGFKHRFVIPCEWVSETLGECVRWVETYPGWQLGIQAHKTWGLP